MITINFEFKGLLSKLVKTGRLLISSVLIARADKNLFVPKILFKSEYTYLIIKCNYYGFQSPMSLLTYDYIAYIQITFALDEVKKNTDILHQDLAKAPQLLYSIRLSMACLATKLYPCEHKVDGEV